MADFPANLCSKLWSWLKSCIPFELFPTKSSAVIFVLYMALFINQGLLVTATKNAENEYDYNTTTVVLLSEVCKLLASVVIFLKQNSMQNLLREITNNAKVFWLYLVPAFLYCMYNNLAFNNLAIFDPTTYFLLLQLRVLVTGIIFQVLFKRQLSRKQWLSLLLLMIGCVIKEVPLRTTSIHITAGWLPFVLILIQVFCSCFAGVYNEYLLKRVGHDTDIMVQNLYLYTNSIVCNILFMAVNDTLMSAMTAEAVRKVLVPKVLLIILNNAAIGIVTSLFLLNLNSILKTFASALELLFTAVLCWLIFGIPVNVQTFLAIKIVSVATLMYAKNPVINAPNAKTKGSNEEKCSEEEEMVADLV